MQYGVISIDHTECFCLVCRAATLVRLGALARLKAFTSCFSEGSSILAP